MLSHVLACHHQAMIGCMAQAAKWANSLKVQSAGKHAPATGSLNGQHFSMRRWLTLLTYTAIHSPVRVCRFACWQHDTGIDINQFVELLHETLKPSDRTVLLHIVDNINWPRTEEFFRRKSGRHCPLYSFVCSGCSCFCSTALLGRFSSPLSCVFCSGYLPLMIVITAALDACNISLHCLLEQHPFVHASSALTLLHSYRASTQRSRLKLVCFTS